MSLLIDFPDQVIVPKSTITICGLYLKPSMLPEAIISKEDSELFNTFSKTLKNSKNNLSNFKESLELHQAAANDQIMRIRSDAPLLFEGFRNIEKTYNRDDVKQLRRGNISTSFFNKIFENTLKTTAILMRDHPSVSHTTSFEMLQYGFLFRNALCFQVLFMRWVSKGSPDNFNLNTTINDIIDMNFITFSLYFDGILSNDKKLVEIYTDTKKILRITNPLFSAE